MNCILYNKIFLITYHSELFSGNYIRFMVYCYTCKGVIQGIIVFCK